VHHLRAARLPGVQAVLAADLGEVERHLRMHLKVPGDRAQLPGDDRGLIVHVFVGDQGGSRKIGKQESDACRNRPAHGIPSFAETIK
jgi:hypothetical protein